MKFHDTVTSRTYSDRSADPGWSAWCAEHLQPADKDVVDVGCGGGIYSRGFAALGARSVTGIDQSRQYVDEANATASASLRFQLGDASATGLDAASADIVFERAVIHHLNAAQMAANAAETRRILRTGGVFVVQDRTFDDVLATDNAFWIRASLLECFPRLLDYEQARRPGRDAYVETLCAAGFDPVRVLSYQEVRKHYPSFEELKQEILTRKGKSILFELSDAELASYCEVLEQKSAGRELIECDLWTIWLAQA